MSDDKVSEPTKIDSLERYSRNIETIVKVVSKNEPRKVSSRRDMSTHTVCDALVGDETGCIYLTLWDDDVDNISGGQILSIKNAKINIFRGSMRLSLGRQGTYDSLEDAPFEEIKLENNLSNKVYGRDREYRRPFRSRRRY
jgi:replication factor A1